MFLAAAGALLLEKVHGLAEAASGLPAEAEPLEGHLTIITLIVTKKGSHAFRARHGSQAGPGLEVPGTYLVLRCS